MNKANFPGISPFARDTTHNYLKTHQGLKTQNTTLRILCVISFVVTCFNAMFAVMMVYKNTLIVEENLQLIQENRALIALQYQQFMIQGYLPDIVVNDNSEDQETTYPKTEKFARMIDIHLPRADCPPCTTEKPSVVQPHKNPVSILNELTHYAKYECDHQCLNPPIHLSTLTVTDPDHPTTTVTGKGESKQKSKQVAAYLALKDLFPEKLDEIAEEHNPDLGYNPVCLDKSMVHTNRTGC